METSPKFALGADLRQAQDLGEPMVQHQSEGQQAATDLSVDLTQNTVQIHT